MVTKGDQNTGFFHAVASERKKKNYIRKLKNEDGNVVAGEEPKSFIANQYQQFFYLVQVTNVMSCWIVLTIASPKI